MANWSNPLLTSTYTNFLTEVKDRDTDLALQFDGTTSTNIPTNAIRWNSSVNRWQKWNGSTWGELTSTYALTGLTTTGNATIGGTLGSGTFTSTGSVIGTALLPTGSTVPTNGIYLPSANVLGIATSSTARLIIDASGNVGIGTLSAATGLHVGNAASSATSGNLFIGPTTAGQARLRLFNGGGVAEWVLGQKTSTDHAFKLSKLVSGSESDYFTVSSSGYVGIGTNAPISELEVSNGIVTAGKTGAVLIGRFSSAFPSTGAGYFQLSTINTDGTNGGLSILTLASGVLGERLRIDSSGRVGIGTSSPQTTLDIAAGGMIRHASTGGNNLIQVSTNSDANGLGMWAGGNSRFYATGSAIFAVNATIGTGTPTGYIDALTIDSSGRLLVGTSSARSLYGQTSVIQTEGTGFASSGIGLILNNASAAGPLLQFGKSRGSANGSSTIVQNGDILGEIYFNGADGTDLDTPGALIRAEVDGTPGANDMPGRLVFSTTADGAANPTERMRIDSAGVLKFNSGFGSVGNAYGCRAWANINAGATPVIRASGNVSSVTDYGAGVGAFTVSFTAAMPDANFAAVVSAGGGNVEGGDAVVGWAGDFATGYVRIGIKDSTSNANVDAEHCMVAVFR